MEVREFTGRSVEDALTTATVELGVTSDRLNYEVVEKGSSGFSHKRVYYFITKRRTTRNVTNNLFIPEVHFPTPFS